MISVCDALLGNAALVFRSEKGVHDKKGQRHLQSENSCVLSMCLGNMLFSDLSLTAKHAGIQN